MNVALDIQAHETEEELPAWSLPADAVDRIRLDLGWPAEVTREWAFGGATGELGLNFGAPGVLFLTMKGRQVPIGTPTAASAQGETKGTWTVKSGTGSYAGATGSGTYVFSTSRNSPSTFEVARIQLEGTLN